MKKAAFIGAGNMATAIIGGIYGAKLDIFLTVYDLDYDKLGHLKENYNVVPASSIKDAICDVDCVFLAVKPQNFPDVLSEMKDGFPPNIVVISIAAGITPEYISKALGVQAKVVQVMPNTPLLLGYGATALSKSENVNEEEFAFVRKIFDCSGITAVLPKNKMNEVIAINGSTPAFIYRYAQCFINYGVSVGISEDTCLKLFAQTLIGSAKMMTDSGETLDKLIAMVSSKGGTTIAGLNALEEKGLSTAVQAACESSVKRAYELAK